MTPEQLQSIAADLLAAYDRHQAAERAYDQAITERCLAVDAYSEKKQQALTQLFGQPTAYVTFGTKIVRMNGDEIEVFDAVAAAPSTSPQTRPTETWDERAARIKALQESVLTGPRPLVENPESPDIDETQVKRLDRPPQNHKKGMVLPADSPVKIRTYR